MFKVPSTVHADLLHIHDLLSGSEHVEKPDAPADGASSIASSVASMDESSDSEVDEVEELLEKGDGEEIAM